MKSLFCLLLLSFVLVHSGKAQTTDTLKVKRLCATLTFEETMHPGLKPEKFVFTPLSDTLLIEWSKWRSSSSKPIAIRKVLNDTIIVSFTETGKTFLAMDCYEIYLVKLPGVFSLKKEVVVSIKDKFFTVSNLTTGVEVNQISEEVLFFPNPTKNQVFINKNNYSNIIVRNALGQEVLQTPASVSSIDLGAFETGVYYLTFLSEKGVVTKVIYKY